MADSTREGRGVGRRVGAVAAQSTAPVSKLATGTTTAPVLLDARRCAPRSREADAAAADYSRYSSCGGMFGLARNAVALL
jgi:hypothetical protein